MQLQPFKGQKSRTAKPVKVNGIRFPSITAACNHFGISRNTHQAYRRKGWSSEKIFTEVKEIKKPRWSEEEIYKLKKLANQGAIPEEIAIALNRSYRAISAKAAQLGISFIRKGENHPHAKLTNLQVAMIHTLGDAGFTIKEIHESAFNQVSKETITDIIYYRTHKG